MLRKTGASSAALASDFWADSRHVIDIHRSIRDEQIRLIYHHGTALVVSATVCAVVLTLFLWFNVPSHALIYWLCALVGSGFARLACIFIYTRTDQEYCRRSIWATLFWVGTMIAGIIWGSWPLFFYWLYSVEHLMLVSAIFAAMVAVSAMSGSIYLPAFLAFSIPLVLPLSVLHIMSGVDSLQLVGLLLLLFLSLSFLLAAGLNRHNRELIYCQFENQQLLAHLADEKLVAERAMVAKSRFLAAASHDLRQPLHALGLFISALRSREKEPGKMRIIEDMSKSADALNSLFNSLLDVSRLDADIIDVNSSHVPADPMFDALRAQFEQQAEEKNIQLRMRAGNHVLYCDRVLLERVLRNLLSNAVQYTPCGSITLHCNDHSDGLKLIKLEDTGIGIPQDALQDVFSEYYQLNNPARDRQKGLGLGLSIVRRLCSLMDLPLDVQSVEGDGTTFSIVVPSGDARKVATQVTPLHAVSAHKRNVLVIDDEPQVLQGMQLMLEHWGCEVALADSARAALRLLALSDSVPDVLISDYRLADLQSGVDAVAAIRECLEFEVPAIIITGDTSPERLRQVRDAGLQLLHKPVRADELYGLIQILLENNMALRSSYMNERKTSNGQE